MIQSRQPVPPTAPNENSNVPEVATFTTIQVLFNSPESKQPSFNVVAELGFVCGFEMVLDVVNSTTFPEPLGSIWKVAFVQMFTAPEQSEATTGPGGGGGVVPQGAQITFANQPVDVVDPSEINWSVKHPVVEVTF
jgi:hypothetical protein